MSVSALDYIEDMLEEIDFPHHHSMQEIAELKYGTRAWLEAHAMKGKNPALERRLLLDKLGIADK